jgi:acetyl esterase
MASRLDPDAQDLLDVMAAGGLAPLHTLSVEQARTRMRAALITKGTPLALAGVEDLLLPTPAGALPLRLYRPTSGRLPVALFIHGGGWTINDLDTHDELCRRLATRSGWMLASLDYRRAPEHPHPAALEDAYLAYRWLLDNGPRIDAEPESCAVVGESSGGTTAAALTLMTRDLGAPQPCCQVLAYPLTDSFDSWPSYQAHGSGYTLDRELMRWFLSHYLPSGHDPEDAYSFPLRARDLSSLARALVLTAEFDPLRDEGIAYARALAGAGVPVEHVHAADQMHGFLLHGRAVAKADALIDRVADYLVAVHDAATDPIAAGNVARS